MPSARIVCWWKLGKKQGSPFKIIPQCIHICICVCIWLNFVSLLALVLVMVFEFGKNAVGPFGISLVDGKYQN